MQRRTFLKRGLLLGGAVLAANGVRLALMPGKISYTPSEPLAVFNAKQFNVMAAIAARVVTAPGASPVALAHTIDAALSRAAPEAQADLLQVLDLFENALAGDFLDGRNKPFTRLSPEEQDRTLLVWRDSHLALRRGAYKALKNLCVTSYYRKETAWPQVGYPGPPPIGVMAGGTP